LKLTKGLEMQKAVGNIVAPHPELESELQEEYQKVEAKVAEGTVTKAEADHLHSLEARCHGHTEKGGLTSLAQSVAAKRERQLSDASNQQGHMQPSAGSATSPSEQSRKDKEAVLHKTEDALRPKIENEPDHITKEDAAILERRERRAHGVIPADSLAAQAQSLADNNANLHEVEVTLRPKIENEPDKEDAALLESRERKAHGNIEKGSMASCAQSLVDKAETQAPQPAH
jgi:hypothetical protein